MRCDSQVPRWRRQGIKGKKEMKQRRMPQYFQHCLVLGGGKKPSGEMIEHLVADDQVSVEAEFSSTVSRGGYLGLKDMRGHARNLFCKNRIGFSNRGSQEILEERCRG